MCTFAQITVINMCENRETTNDTSNIANEEIQWFVAIVHNRSEKLCANRLDKLGVENYVPIQKEMHQWKSGARKMVERIVLPAMVFIRTTERDRKSTVVKLPYIKRFMPNRSCTSNAYGRSPVAVIPNDQIDRLKFILGNSDAPVEFEPVSYRLGDKVRVARGGLMGMEGNIVECPDGENAYFAIRVDFLGLAKVKIARGDLEKIFP